MTPEPTSHDAPVRIPDLAEHHRCQAELYAALAAYQHACTGEAQPSPGAFGLAIHCVIDGVVMRAVLTHSAGGEISCGPIELEPEWDWFEAAADAGRLLLNPLGNLSTTAKAESTVAPSYAVEAPQPTLEPSPPTPMDLDGIDSEEIPENLDEPPTAEEIEAITLQLEAIHAKNPDGVNPIITAYKGEHNIGRSPFIKSITTRERLNTITRLIAEHTT